MAELLKTHNLSDEKLISLIEYLESCIDITEQEMDSIDDVSFILSRQLREQTILLKWFNRAAKRRGLI